MTVTGLDQKTSDQTGMRTGNHCQVTCQHPGNAGSDPKDYELCRAVEFLDPWADDPEAIHIHQDMQQIDMNKNWRNEPPILMPVMNPVIRFSAKRQQHAFGELTQKN